MATVFEAPPPTEMLVRWMREERAGLKLSDIQAQALAELHGESLWNEENVVRGNVSYSSTALDDIRAMVAIIASEAVDHLVEKKSVPDRDAHKRLAIHKYITWWMEPSFIWGGGAPPLVEAAEVPAGPAYSRATAAAPVLSEPASAEPAPSKTALEDMRQQGASRVSQLVTLSVSAQVGQKVEQPEVMGAVYGGAVSTAAIIKRMNKNSKGAKTLDDLLREAMLTGSLSDVNRHIRKTISRFLDDSNDRLFVDAGGNLGQLWSRAQELNTATETRVAIKFMQLSLEEYSCRGIPRLDDWSIIHDAERYGYATMPVKEPQRGGGGSSQSPAQSDEKFTEMLKVLKGVADQQKAMEQAHEDSMAKTMKEIGDLRSRIGRNGDRERGDRERGDRERGERGDRDDKDRKKDATCTWCKKKGHFVASCPDMLKALKQRDEAEE